MALVCREAAALEGRIERDLASQVSNYKQLMIAKRAVLEGEKEQPETCEGLTRSQKLLWYRKNQDKIDLDNWRAGQSSNYRQLELLRGKRGVEETEEERAARGRTKAEALMWYRYKGGEEEIDRQRSAARMCSSWQQYKLMTEGRTYPRDEDQELTKSEALLWYRQGGSELVDIRDELARNSSNWRQFQLSRDTNQAAMELESKMNTNWSRFKGKEELSEYVNEMRAEAAMQREEVRTLVRSRVSSMTEDTVTKKAVIAHQRPWSYGEVEEEEKMREEADMRSEERIARLRKVTEEMLTARNEYAVSTRDLVMKAIKEDEAAVAASRTSKKTTIINQGTVAA